MNHTPTFDLTSTMLTSSCVGVFRDPLSSFDMGKTTKVLADRDSKQTPNAFLKSTSLALTTAQSCCAYVRHSLRGWG